MFGYVTICEPELKMKDFRRYKAYYCGLCQTLKERHGSLGQMTLAYDMTFVIILLTSLYECELKSSAHRCKVHPIKKQIMLQNEFAEYAADMNLILAYYHMKDDWQDERKVSGLLGTAALRRKAERAVRKYPRQSRVIREELKALECYEKADSQNIDETAGCFGRLMEELLVYKKDVWEEALRTIGFFLGKFIYIMDAYEDMNKDLKEGNYNPLKELNKSENYEERCREMLCMMIAESSSAFEKLPCLIDADILRNILYAGVWTRYNKLQKKREEANVYTEHAEEKKRVKGRE
ncbi:DUF5685 family protein [Mediterraneibacter agrestimuris]|uniref:DUF5685 family protein n=1 Tax=Mediterraneibacter agrestimuris TaxID=2941333 RepID=UPI00203E8CF0|nr:DUF5685 family protein [Mediterraneibacter agrestimuris]